MCIRSVSSGSKGKENLPCVQGVDLDFDSLVLIDFVFYFFVFKTGSSQQLG